MVRLEVAMDDQIAVRITHRLTGFTEQHAALLDREIALFAVRVDRNALDIFHDEERCAVPGRASIQKPRDIGVIQAGQDLPLLPESLQQRNRRQRALYQLDSYPLLVLVVIAHGGIDCPHTARSQLVRDAVRPYAPARVLARTEQRLRCLLQRPGNGSNRRTIEREKGFYLAAQFGIVAALFA